MAFYLLLLLVGPLLAYPPQSTPHTSAPGTSTIDKARSFQASLNRAVSQNDYKGVSSKISNFFVHDKCTGADGDQRTFTQDLLRERKLGIVTGARDNGEYITYNLNYGNKKMEYKIGSEETNSVPRLLYMAKEQCQGGPFG